MKRLSIVILYEFLVYAYVDVLIFNSNIIYICLHFSIKQYGSAVITAKGVFNPKRKWRLIVQLTLTLGILKPTIENFEYLSKTQDTT